jgi:hypothetical protein
MMISFEKITRYDMVKVIRVPDEYKGLIDVGDIGIVVEQLDEETFEIECVTPDGSFKWLETLNVRFISKYLGSAAAIRQTVERQLMRSSVRLGTVIGASAGAVIGLGLGAITMNMNGSLIGMGVGLILGLVTGAGAAALTVKTAGTTGGVGVGYFTGMLFGGAFGLLIGALIPASLRMRANTHGLPVLDALMMGRFETAVLVSFFLSILATIVSVWIGGMNYVPRNKKES